MQRRQGTPGLIKAD